MSSVRWILVRHAPAEARDPVAWPNDHDRPLRPEGRKEFLEASQGLVRLLEARGTVASSPWQRAQETAGILQGRWGAGGPATWPALVPTTPLPELFRRARSHRAPGDLVLVGHEPHFSRFVGYCLTGEATPLIRVSKGGAIALDFPGQVRPGGGRLLWALTRGQLRRARKGDRGPSGD